MATVAWLAEDAEATGDAFTLVDKEEEPMVREIEQVLHRTLPRVTLPGFNYRRPGGFESAPARGRRNFGRSHSGQLHRRHHRR